jgi:single-strand DNA-binding protein
MNKVNLMGRLTRDPEVRYANNSNMPIAKFTLAVDRKFSKEGEERQTDFISCTAFNKTAELIGKFFPKGKQMALCGRIQTGSYEKEGQKVYTTDVIVEDVYFTGSKKDSEGSNSQSFDQDNSDSGFTPIDLSDDQLPF